MDNCQQEKQQAGSQNSWSGMQKWPQTLDLCARALKVPYMTRGRAEPSCVFLFGRTKARRLTPEMSEDLRTLRAILFTPVERATIQGRYCFEKMMRYLGLKTT